MRKYQNLKDTLGASGLVALVVALTILGSFAVWGLFVLISPLVGSGNIHRDVQDAKNREHWSAVFNGRFNQIRADRAQIAVISDSLLTGGNTAQDKIDLQGARMNCLQDVALYNADTQNVLASPWLPAGLPATISDAEFCGPAAP